MAWGSLHGVYQIIGKMTRPVRVRLARRTGWDKVPVLPQLCRVCCTFGLVLAGYVFFRSTTFEQAAYIFTHVYRGWGIFADPAGAVAAFVSLADSVKTTLVILVFTTVLWAVEFCEYRTGERFETLTAKLPRVGQWVIYYSILFVIALFGAFGQSAFIYFQF